MKRLIFMTIPKYIILFFFVVCGLSASCADSNQVDESSQSFPSPGELLQRAYLKNAEKGDASAQCELGFLYDTGNDGAEQNYEKARGKGVPQNFVEAYKWYSLAVPVGNVSADSPITKDTILPLNALKMRDELAKQMTPEQLADAQKRTEKFWSDMKK
jgi:Sel1 repeat